MVEEKRKGRGRRWPESASVALTSGIFNANGNGTSDSVYEQLRHAILYGQIPPGAWLRQTDLAKQFGVSRTPIREAMRSLEQEGLVELVPNHGARATNLTLEAFEELYALRIGLEGLAARLAARMASVDDINRLTEEYATLEAYVEAYVEEKPVQDYLKHEWQFRVSCYAVTRRDRLIAQVKYLRQHAERYLALAYTIQGRANESIAYHRALLEAIRDGDEDEAERVNQEALRWTLQKAGPIIAEFVGDNDDIPENS